MLHRCSSEFLSLMISACLLTLVAAYRAMFHVWPSSHLSPLQLVIPIVVYVALSRYVARGIVYQWPSAAHSHVVSHESSADRYAMRTDDKGSSYDNTTDEVGREGKQSQGIRASAPSEDGRVALVIGASSGVGYAVAEQLALHGFTVLLAGRCMDRLLRARNRILARVCAAATKSSHHAAQTCASCCMHTNDRRTTHTNTATRSTHVCSSTRDYVLHRVRALDSLDVSVESSIQRFVTELTTMQNALPIRLVIHAAGVMHRHRSCCPPTSGCLAGVETMLATNALGPLLLTQLMLPMLERNARRLGCSARVVFVASSCHTFLGPCALWSRYDPIAMVTDLLGGKSVSPKEARTETAHRIPSTSSSSSSNNSNARTSLMHNMLDKDRHTVHNTRREELVYSTVSPGGLSSLRARVKDGDESACQQDFTWLNFVGYYGLSKLCVVWNTRLVAEQVARLPALGSSTTHSGANEPQQEDGICCRDTSPDTSDKWDVGNVRDAHTRKSRTAASSRPPSPVIIATCCHPGVIVTHLYRQLLPIWLLDYVVYWPSLLFGRTWTESAQPVLRAALEEEQQDSQQDCCACVLQGGYYLCDGNRGVLNSTDTVANSRCCLSPHARDDVALSQYKKLAFAQIGI